MSFQKVLDKYRKYSFSERDKGERFERLIQAYLQTDPKYSNQFKYVWLWNEFPGRKDFGGKDTGIDLVGLTFEDDYWAIQCKCYQESSTIDKNAVDSFLSTSSRSFKNESFQTTEFSNRLWISTTNKWGVNAEETIKNQNPPLTRINLNELNEAPVDWGKLENGISGDLARKDKHTLRTHQTQALEKTHEHFKENDRGKLIMACGTGKTFTSLKIAENETKGEGLILFLVPSIALLGQTLSEWSANSEYPINPICICSDSRITKKHSKADDSTIMSVVDLALPASTNVPIIVKQFKGVKAVNKKGMTVVFSTYQSIDVIAAAQKELKQQHKIDAEFDLIICDEAHRTTGTALTVEDSSHFIKVHDNDFLKGKKRLYMTATPRLYSDDSKSKAAQNDAVICSMDDTSLYGEEIYRIGFGEAVQNDLLSDYKVLILTLSDADVPPAIQAMVANSDQEINSDDASKLIGCINALSKQVLGDEGLIKSSDPNPMKRSVAFCQNINVSRKITRTFNDVSEQYLDSIPLTKRENLVTVSSKHIDGSMSAPERDELLGWLKSTSADTNESRILTNVRCLSEGVDVPSLDAVMFLSARNSQVDVVQSVGRVMRRAKGKNYGYIIIPVVVPSNVEASEALDDNERFKVVWSVLNALRAHDDRFNATINKIDLNKKKPKQILIGRPTPPGYVEGEEGTNPAGESGESYGKLDNQLALQFEQLQSVMYARMVKKVGDRRYWEQWASSVAEIAEKQVERINRLIEEDGEHKKSFEQFLKGLQKNINPAITQQQAVDMLSQHIITKPVFEALFEGYSFVKSNPISVSMQTMLDLLEKQAIEKDTEVLEKFYDSVRRRAEGIDNAEGKQRIIIELYDKFFKTAFPKMVEQLGIVYTPVEVVDFIIHSVNDILQKEFGRGISDENVHILDPFTGTGTFMTRLLQSGLIRKEDLARKYTKELHANEIVLLAYYIAAVNIENAYHDLLGKEEDYETFEGIVLTDTFQLGESETGEKLFSEMFPKNSERVEAQKKAPIRVIMGNPPYSKGQKSSNDNAQNQSYEHLDKRISETYVRESTANNSNAVYDSYVKAFRWSSDRLDKENGGIIAFVCNNGWLEGSGMDGVRKVLQKEFSSIYVFNLRGNQRTSGELSRKEGGKIFGSGSRTPISITFLVKNPNYTKEIGEIFYRDIGDYLSRDEKLLKIKELESLGHSQMKWKRVFPNEFGDWLNQRSDIFSSFIPIQPDKKFDIKCNSYFTTYSLGIASARDAWVYNSSIKNLRKNMVVTIAFYNKQRAEFEIKKSKSSSLDFKKFCSNDSTKISWNESLRKTCASGKEIQFNLNNCQIGLYRPFTKLNLYFDKNFIQRPYQQTKLFPTKTAKNKVIVVSGIGGNKGFSILITDKIPDLQLISNGQAFPLHFYEKTEKNNPNLFDEIGKEEYIKRDGVSDFIFDRARKMYGKNVQKEDIFYYVYGILHSDDYRSSFSNDLKKMLPRIPLVDEPRDFWKFSKAGRTLADLHINYEEVAPFEEVEINHLQNNKGDGYDFYRVQKLKFPKKTEKNKIIYNSRITIENIPTRAYEYIVNGKSAIEWIMDRYQVKTDKKSGIKNDPNDWSKEVENPKYILDLILSVINVSVQTVDIVNSLPDLKFEEEMEAV
ncbi:DEAD/DEAH box helicase family protein [Salegentibacter sp. BLCTC]|uniref:DEAD/DEAH box helicase n=1 Tax=Salegentibacter sp. BLCTC TaxID=2697368 RepID=UPI00187BB2CC|nr:type ISP restriction/modification enzyme [Salegentibacter sp. BLCTC]MBE7641402.1 DEAD/DEAH box helicase family protein [Salegentibacter sp. BLCTC]